jgi:oxaloacetate decarboxylase alpha subunit
LAEIRFTDTTVRDGPQSLWAHNLRTSMLLAVAPLLDQAGFEAIETIYVPPSKSIRELRDDPWERIGLLRKHAPNTPVRSINSRFPMLGFAPPALWELQMQCLARAGVDQARISDDWNQPEVWEYRANVARSVGITPLINLIYSYSPKHTDAYYAERARRASQLDVWRLVLKDPGGLLTPDRMRTLVPAVMAEARDKEFELHGHCTTGLGPLNALEAASLGFRNINTGVPPLANGNALPSIFNVAANLRSLGFTPVIDEQPLREVERRLAYIARRERFPLGRPVEPDVSQYDHQIPGGMLSNLRHQLTLVGLEHRYQEALEECARVREEFGYPIMVTPLSQFVGSQAVINVIVGERYKQVTDQTILYALGRWGGQECIQAMDLDVRDRILSSPRARELAGWEPPNLTLEEVRQQYGAPGMSDEDLLLRYEIAESEIARVRASGTPQVYPIADHPLMDLLTELSHRTDRGFIAVQKGEVRLTLQKQVAM